MSGEGFHADTYLVPPVLHELRQRFPKGGARLIDMGCGDGFAADALSKAGFHVRGFDLSEAEIAVARARNPELDLQVMSLYDDGVSIFSRPVPDAVLALEVVEHLFTPKALFAQAYKLLPSGGLLLVSTPYHGYFKNLALSILNRWDSHLDVTWDGGHIKFFSPKTLAAMAETAGFQCERVISVGRIPGFAKSMILVANKK
jgi:2-polyprenyl-3-methyl-5-hydroxy-6-metoxy-1,4-benzoquinol methylase